MKSTARITLSTGPGKGKGADRSISLDLPPDFLARFEICRSLGRGGMGEVFEAHDHGLGRAVAIKFCTAYADAQARKRFEHEATLMAQIRHPNVVGVLTSGVVDMIPYLVMPIVRGRTLRQVLQETGGLGVDQAVRVMDQVLAGLDAAHHQGIVHRDLKPENVLVTDAGDAMLLDLGVAKSWADGSALAASGQITGTPAYMAPEQCQGLPTGIAADLYAAGVILFEMLAGTPPYGGASARAVLEAHLRAPVPRLTGLKPDMAEAWDHLLAKALAKSPSDRFPDAEAFRLALTKARAGQFSASTLPTAQALESRSLALLVKGRLATASGLAILGGLAGTSMAALANRDPALSLMALMPIFTLFVLEEPGRFAQLKARISYRALVYACASVVTGGLVVVSPEHEAAPYLMWWILTALHLAWFGGYHSRDPREGSGIMLHKRMHILVVTLSLVIMAPVASAWALGLGALSVLLSMLGAVRPPVRSRHLPIGTATTAILFEGLTGRSTSQVARTAGPGATMAGPPPPLPAPDPRG